MAATSVTIQLGADTARIQDVLHVIAKHAQACADELADLQVEQEADHLPDWERELLERQDEQP